MNTTDLKKKLSFIMLKKSIKAESVSYIGTAIAVLILTPRTIAYSFVLIWPAILVILFIIIYWLYHPLTLSSNKKLLKKELNEHEERCKIYVKIFRDHDIYIDAKERDFEKHSSVLKNFKRALKKAITEKEDLIDAYKLADDTDIEDRDERAENETLYKKYHSEFFDLSKKDRYTLYAWLYFETKKEFEAIRELRKETELAMEVSKI